MAREALRIDSAEKLTLLQRDVHTGLGRRYRSVTFALPDLSERENSTIQKRINRLYLACGCGEATILGFAALIAYGVWFLTRTQPFTWWDPVWAFAAFFAATTVGKLAGLWRAHLRLKAEVSDLVDRHGEIEKPTEEEPLCAVN
ncbi:MAG: hypothetical protein JSU82_13240 [Rhodospirillales bacterium]|nr:MAG: hypothetical protein JSU82_13240 [Rhodospirillales bacterium]